jgi:phosphoserine phosphatase
VQTPPELIVDLCGTIVRENTTHEFLRRVPLAGRAALERNFLLSRWGFLAARVFPSFAHRRRSIACLAGRSRVELNELADDYARDALARCGRADVLARVAARPQATWLASASIDVIVAAFARSLGVAGFIACELDYPDGICSGRILADSESRKLEKLNTKLGQSLHGFDLITDNPEDQDLMRVARHVDFIEPPR